MKILSISLALWGVMQLSAQCPTTDLQFSNQQSIDSFAIAYPGCKDILGSVMIMGSDITHLDGLSRIETVGVFFAVYFCDSLKNLKGLEHLYSVGDALDLTGNKYLSSVSDLKSLKHAASVTINRCSGLLSLDGLNQLENVPHFFEVSGNDRLVNLSGLEGLHSIGNSLSIEQNQNLVNLKGLDSLTSIGGSPITLTSGLKLFNNPSLESLEGLDHPFTVNSVLEISANDSLSSLKALSQMTGPKSLTIVGSRTLKTLEGLEHIKQLSFGLNLSENNALNSLEPLSGLRSLGDLAIFGNSSLINLKGLDSLESVRTLALEQTRLKDFTGLGSLKQITGQFLIDNNPMLSSFDGLDQLTSIQLDVLVMNNFSLSGCAIEAICKKFDNVPSLVFFDSNGPGCNSNPEVYNACFPVSVSAEPEAGGPIVFPNPSTGWVQFRYQDGVALSIQVMNAWGQLVLEQQDTLDRYVDLSGQAPGLYWIIFQAGEKQWRQPLLISRGQ